MPNGRILKPGRPLTVPNNLMHIYDVNQEDPNNKGITEFETWSEVSSYRFGIILIKSNYTSNVRNNNLLFHIGNYNFYTNRSDWNTAIIAHENGTSELVLHQPWSHNKPLYLTVKSILTVNT